MLNKLVYQKIKRSRDPSDKKFWNKFLIAIYIANGTTTYVALLEIPTLVLI